MAVTLLHETGGADVDDLLRVLISILELSFPARIRCCYLGGSYGDGTAVASDHSANSSDVDLFVVFRSTIDGGEGETFQHIVGVCRLISPLSLDAHASCEDDLLGPLRPEATQVSFLNALIRVAGVPIYGDDIRAALPDVPFPRYVLDVIESGVFPIGIPRQPDAVAYPLPRPLTYPLAYPNLDGEFYGYDAVPARPDTPRGTRVLVSIAAWIATMVLALETGRYAGHKSQSIRLCKEYLPHDKRTRFAAAIVDTCKGEWGYALPDSREDRERLRVLCRDTLALENEYLALCRDYLLGQLRHGGDGERRQATRILRSVIFTDDEVRAALKAL